LDHLIHILVDKAVPYFIHQHRRQDFGFEGADLETQERLKIEKVAKLIPKASVQPTNDLEIFEVQSSSIPDHKYRVDLDAYDCDCLSFSSICFCKHICAVQLYFPESCPFVPTSALNIYSKDSIVPYSSPVNPVKPAESENLTSTRDSVHEIEIKQLIDKLSKLVISIQNNPTLPSEALTEFQDHVDSFYMKILVQDAKCYDFEQFRLYSRDCNSRFCIWVLKG